MAFDPTLPVENTPLDAAQMRAQLNGLNDLNTALQSRVNTLEAQLAAHQARWDALDNQLSTMSPLNISDADPLTQDEVQSVGAQSDLLLGALKGA
jgi:hypothetical protein